MFRADPVRVLCITCLAFLFALRSDPLLTGGCSREPAIVQGQHMSADLPLKGGTFSPWMKASAGHHLRGTGSEAPLLRWAAIPSPAGCLLLPMSLVVCCEAATAP